MLHHVHYRVPVTALEFHGSDIILAGEGNRIRVYNVTTRKLLADIQVFRHQVIHGITGVRGSSTVIVWGGCLIRTLSIEAEYCRLSLNLGSLGRASDWILDASVNPGGRLLAVASAHNVLTVTEIQSLTHAGFAAELTVLGAYCLLYSAHITWLSASKCLIASGTAFGDVIVWSCCLASDRAGKLVTDSKVHYAFSSHEGSVFGVQIVNDIYLSKKCHRLLATCSDDRTVRLWDISNLDIENSHLVDTSQRSGFHLKRTFDGHAPPCLAEAMGHASRIWHVRFVRNSNPLQLLTFGEDASNITWTLRHATNADRVSQYDLLQTILQLAHAGKNIWSVTESPDGFLATGGADGAIALRPAAETATETEEVSRNCCLDDGDYFKAYSFIGGGTLLATTDRGHVVLLSLDRSAAQIDCISPPLQGIRHYSMVSSLGGVGVIAGTDGIIYGYDHKSGWFGPIAGTEGKTAGLFLSASSDSLILFATTVGGSDAFGFKLDAINADKSATNAVSPITVLATWKLPLASSNAITSFQAVRTSDSSCTTTFITGSRNGTIIIRCQSESHGEILKAVASIPHAHGKETVTSLQWIQASSGKGYLYSTGRDGTLAVHLICNRPDDVPSIALVHRLSLPFGPDVEGQCLVASDLWLWGFQGKEFVVYNQTAQKEVMHVECGGSHRNFAFEPNLESCTFVWTKASKLYRKTQLKPPYHVINGGGHGREIRATAASPNGPQILATGAEDTNIKLWLVDQPNDFECIQTLRKHNTGIRHLQWSQCGTYLLSSGGFEEFMVWKVATDVPRIGIGVICESAHPRSGESDLRIMGFHALTIAVNASPDIDGFEVTMAYSDSTVKIWQYVRREWVILSSTDYLTASLTSVVYIDSDHGRGSRLLTAATDGHLACWTAQGASADRSLGWSRRHKVHQSAIVCLVSHRLSNGVDVVCTGGDDGALGITVFEGMDARTAILSRAHVAAMTGLALTQIGTDRVWLISAGLDQRIKLWEVTVDVEKAGVDGVEVKLVRDEFTPVADISGVELCQLPKGGMGVAVCGVGMDFWGLRPPNGPDLQTETTMSS